MFISLSLVAINLIVQHIQDILNGGLTKRLNGYLNGHNTPRKRHPSESSSRPHWPALHQDFWERWREWMWRMDAREKKDCLCILLISQHCLRQKRIQEFQRLPFISFCFLLFVFGLATFDVLGVRKINGTSSSGIVNDKMDIFLSLF